MVGVAVAVGVSVAVAVTVRVAVGIAVSVARAVAVGVCDGVAVDVKLEGVDVGWTGESPSSPQAVSSDDDITTANTARRSRRRSRGPCVAPLTAAPNKSLDSQSAEDRGQRRETEL